MVSNFTIPEVIAQFDALERDMQVLVSRLREYRHMLFETLDSDPDDLVD